MLEIIVKVIAAYLLGNVLGGDLSGQFRNVNLRNEGSGNVGATNAMRSQGLGFALIVLLIDMGKAVLAVLLVPLLPWYCDGAGGSSQPSLLVSSLDAQLWLPALCGVAVILGHCYPIWHRFQGGKGVACMVGTVAVLATSQFPWLVLVWVAVLVLSGYVSLASILASATLLVWLLLEALFADVINAANSSSSQQAEQSINGLADSLTAIATDANIWPLLLFALWLAVFIMFSHRSNMQRLLQGNESRFPKVMLLHRWLRIGPHRSR